jgi:6-phosphogluconolactonase (cycloisomerase 2 family)
MRTSPRSLGGLLLATLFTAACGTDPQPTGPAAASLAALHSAGTAVVTASNAAAGNELLYFPREGDGSLGAPVSYATGGLGTGAGLGNQGGIARSADGRFLLVVNAGSNDVSVFGIGAGRLERVGTFGSGGTTPLSITVSRDLVYVLNGGGSGNITGFTLSPTGVLTPLAGSTRPLSSGASGPAQVGFSPNGRFLVVTEKATNSIITYDVAPDGLTTGPTVYPSAGMTPFGFAFGRENRLFVSEAFGGATDASALSSYRLGTGGLGVLSASVPTTETAACWVQLSADGRFAYTTNTGSSTITGYAVRRDGTLERMTPDGVTAMTGTAGTPIDLALTDNGRYLYSLNPGNQSITGFLVGSDGGLTPTTPATGIPASANGLAAW